MIFYCSRRNAKDGSYLLDAAVFEIEKDDGRTFFLWNLFQRLVELLVAESRICGVAGGDAQGLGTFGGNRLADGFPQMVDIAVVGNPKEPGAEFGKPQEGAGGHVGPYQGVLRDVIGEGGVATAQAEQEPPERLLLLPDEVDEPLPGHLLLRGLKGFFFGLNLLGEHLLAHKIDHEKCDAYGKEDSTGYGKQTQRPFFE